MKSLGIAIFMMLSAVLSNGADLRTGLEISPQTLVVGLAPSIFVEVTNISNRPLGSPVSAVLLVSPMDGSEPFFARMGKRVFLSADPEWNDETRALAPRQTIQLEFPATASLIEPAWFSDSRFEKPGSWRLQIALVPPGLQHAHFEVDSTAALVQRLTSSGYLSPAVTFTSTAPAGDDAAVCQLVSERTGVRGCPIRSLIRHPDLVREIVAEYPKSSYFPYLVALADPVGNETAARVALYEKTIKLVGPSRTADWYRWLLAAEHEKATFDNDTPAEAVREHERQAHALWNQLGKSKHGALRKGAAKKLKEAAESESGD